MLFKITKNDKVWELTPLSGALEGRIVARVEWVSIKKAAFVARSIEGEVKAIWGATLEDEVYDDIETVEALGIGGRFQPSGSEQLNFDFDGFFDKAGRKCYRAKRMFLIGDAVYAAGVS